MEVVNGKKEDKNTKELIEVKDQPKIKPENDQSKNGSEDNKSNINSTKDRAKEESKDQSKEQPKDKSRDQPKNQQPKNQTKEKPEKERKVKGSDDHTVAQLGRVRAPGGIKACDMKEDEGASRFPQYRGYVLSMAGRDYSLVACGVGQGQPLPALDISYKINDSTLISSHGFHNDVIHFNRDLQEKIDKCVATLGKNMSLLGMAGIVKALLYNRRFFTFFKCNILTGLDQHGGGCMYVFDQMGGFKREAYAAGGSSSINMQKLLAKKIQLTTPRSVQVPLDGGEAADVATDVFRSAAQQKIFNGHAVVIYTITKDGIVEDFRRVKD